MLLYPQAVYENEERIVVLIPSAIHLVHWRIGIVIHDGPTPNQFGFSSLGPYQLVVAFAAVKNNLQMMRRVHRVAYLNCAGAPEFLDGLMPDGSDNLCVPESFRAGEPLTAHPESFRAGDSMAARPTKYGQHFHGGPLGNVRNEWAHRLADYKRSWDAYRARLGLPLLHSSVEQWGDYPDPTF